jgi:hypothetical protein
MPYRFILLLRLRHDLCIAKFSVYRLQIYELLLQHRRVSKAINVKKKKKGSALSRYHK